MVYGQKEQKFGAQDKNTTVHWKSKSDFFQFVKILKIR